MIKQIRCSLVDLYVNEDLHQNLTQYTDNFNFSYRVAENFNLFREEETKRKSIVMSVNDHENELNERYVNMLMSNAISLARRGL